MKIVCVRLLLIGIFLHLGIAQAAPGDIYGSPSASNLIHPADLNFQANNRGLAVAEDRSNPFYAIILKTAAHCSIGEKERLRTQQLFPRNKVFVERYQCADESPVWYTNVNRQVSFMAVYAGNNLTSAKQLLKKVKQHRQFSDANIRRMQVVLEVD